MNRIENKRKFFHLSVRPWGMLSAAGALACLSTVLGFFGKFSWLFDLFAHFRVQYCLGLAVIALLLMLGRRVRSAFALSVFILINLSCIFPLYGSGPLIWETDGQAFRAMLINVNTRLGDPERVKQAVMAEAPDILVLEEISLQWVSDLQWLKRSYPYSLLEAREDNFGIGLFSKFPLNEEKVIDIGEAGVPSICSVIHLGKFELFLIATHPLPPAGPEYSDWRNDQLDQIPYFIMSDMPVMILGDLNATPWSFHFKRLLRRSGLLDSAKGYGIKPTWPAYIPILGIPIDHCLHTSDILISNREVGSQVGSDHFPLIIDFYMSESD